MNEIRVERNLKGTDKSGDYVGFGQRKKICKREENKKIELVALIPNDTYQLVRRPVIEFILEELL